nr:hypothetical protein CFP56_09974 [Quercus suber]
MQSERCAESGRLVSCFFHVARPVGSIGGGVMNKKVIDDEETSHLRSHGKKRGGQVRTTSQEDPLFSSDVTRLGLDLSEKSDDASERGPGKAELHLKGRTGVGRSRHGTVCGRARGRRRRCGADYGAARDDGGEERERGRHPCTVRSHGGAVAGRGEERPRGGSAARYDNENAAAAGDRDAAHRGGGVHGDRSEGRRDAGRDGRRGGRLDVGARDDGRGGGLDFADVGGSRRHGRRSGPGGVLWRRGGVGGGSDRAAGDWSHGDGGDAGDLSRDVRDRSLDLTYGSMCQ